MPVVTISENNEKILKILDLFLDDEFFILALINETIFVYKIKKNYKLIDKIKDNYISSFLGLSNGKILLSYDTHFEIYAYWNNLKNIICEDYYEINYTLENKPNLNFTEEATHDCWPCKNVQNLFYALDMSTFKWDELCVKNVIEINDNNFLFFAENNFTITSKPLNTLDGLKIILIVFIMVKVC